MAEVLQGAESIILFETTLISFSGFSVQIGILFAATGCRSCWDQNINKLRPQNRQQLESWGKMRSIQIEGQFKFQGRTDQSKTESKINIYSSLSCESQSSEAKKKWQREKAATMEPLYWILSAAFHSELIAPPWLRLYCCFDQDGSWTQENPQPLTVQKDGQSFRCKK